MKYLKLYESSPPGIKALLKRTFGKKYDPFEIRTLEVEPKYIFHDLKPFARLERLVELICVDNELESLDGIENLKYLACLDVSKNVIINLNGIEKATKLQVLNCADNSLKDLKGIEDLLRLRMLICHDNQLQNLDEIENLPNLKYLECELNMWEFPLPTKIVKKFGIKYENCNIEYFKTYDLQKEFLTLYPTRVLDLVPFGFHEKIREEFPAIKEWDFFGLI